MENESMQFQQQPLPGNWYVTEIGQLLYVRAVLYNGACVSYIAFEHTNGKRVFMDWQVWRGLRLEPHTHRPEHRGRVKDI